MPQWLDNSPALHHTWGYKLASGPLRHAVAALRGRLADAFWAHRSQRDHLRLLNLEAVMGVWGNAQPAATGSMQRVDLRALPEAWPEGEVLIPRSGIPFMKAQDLPLAEYGRLGGARILAALGGGVGDLIMFAQLFREMRRVHGCVVDIAHLGARYKSGFLERLFAPAEVHRFPIPAASADRYHYAIPIGLHGIIHGESIPEYFWRVFGTRFACSGFETSEEVEQNIRRRLRLRHAIDFERDPPIIVHAACRPEKNYPHFDEVALALVARGHKVVMIGDLHESALADQPGRLANMCGLDLWTSIVLLRHAKLFLGPDSSFMHAAGAWNVPTLALFGPTGAIWATPYPRATVVTHPLSCRFAPCWIVTKYERPCAAPADPPCLRQIPAADVVALVERKLQGKLGMLEGIGRWPKDMVLEDRRSKS